MANLNKEQQLAVENEANVVVVIAGAGSGKTTVLIEKIISLVENKKKYSSKVLSITFTNKAANEIKERLIHLLGDESRNITTSTFHGLAVRLLKRFNEGLEFHSKDFNIIDDQDQLKIIKDCINRLGLKNQYKPKVVRGAISKTKSLVLRHSDIVHELDYDIVGVYNEYQKYLIKNNAMDFDDLLIYLYELLQNKKYQERIRGLFDYILVDEYQDTSLIQAKILQLLKKEETKLFIVGDVDQSIYRWRGALIENILELEKDYVDVSIVKLEQNYRSTKKILDAANLLIANNDFRHDKNLFTNNIKGEGIKVHEFNDAYEEAEFVIKEVDYLKQLGRDMSQVSVLYRYNYQSKLIEDQLVKKGISYVMYGGLKFYQRMEIKDMISYLRLIFNKEDNISFIRVVNAPKRKIGDKAIQNILSYSRKSECSNFDSLKELSIPSSLGFISIIEKYQILLEKDFVVNFTELLKDIKYKDYLVDMDGLDRANERMENIMELMYGIENSIKEGKSINEYLNDLLIFNEEDDVENGVVLSTVHGVKGLEFDNVFIVGLNEGKFPSFSSFDDKHQLEEERRVAYVALTRARKKVIITSYERDYRGSDYKLSRFIDEMQLDSNIDFRF